MSIHDHPQRCPAYRESSERREMSNSEVIKPNLRTMSVVYLSKTYKILEKCTRLLQSIVYYFACSSKGSHKGIIVAKAVVHLQKQRNNCFRLTVRCNFFSLPRGD